MSDAEGKGRAWRFYVQDMLDFGEKVLVYTNGLDEDAFVADTLVYDATLRQHPAHRRGSDACSGQGA